MMKRTPLKEYQIPIQIEPGVTQSYDYKYSYNSMKISRRPDEFNCLTNFHMELHVNPPNSKLTVDPLRDPISLIFILSMMLIICLDI